MDRPSTIRLRNGLRIEFDDDPHLPVCVCKGRSTGSFDCATQAGELGCGEIVLDQSEIDDLNKYADLIDDWYIHCRKDHPEYT